MPEGPHDFPAVRVAIAAVLAFLLVSPHQLPWYAALLFPLLAVFSASRLDWIAIAFAGASAVGALPFFAFQGMPPWWPSRSLRIIGGGLPLSL